MTKNLKTAYNINQKTNRMNDNEKHIQMILEKICNKSSDRLGFTQKSDAIHKFLIENDPPFVYAICGAWGSGKSSFLNILIQDLKSNPISSCVVYYNAFRNSIYSNTLIAFIYSLVSDVEKFLEVNNEKYQKDSDWNINGLKECGKIFIEAAIECFSNYNFLTKYFSTVYKKAKSFKIERSYLDLFEKLKLEDKVRDKFIAFTKKLPSNLYSIYVIIDELDRVPPLTAVQIIESIRILFCDHDAILNEFKNKTELPDHIPYKYIIALDEKYISGAFASKYKLSKKDAHEYLMKFIDHKIYLSPFDWEKLIQDKLKKIEELYNIFSIKKDENGNIKISDEYNSIVELISEVFENFDVETPRQIIRVINYLLSWLYVNKSQIYVVNRQIERYFRKDSDFTEMKNIVIASMIGYLTILSTIMVRYPIEYIWFKKCKMLSKMPLAGKVEVKQNIDERPEEYFGNPPWYINNSEILEGGRVRGDVEIIKVALQSSIKIINEKLYGIPSIRTNGKSLYIHLSDFLKNLTI